MRMGNNGLGDGVHSVIVLGTPNVKRLKGRERSFMYEALSDDKAIVLLNEFAKVDPKALKLMALLQAAKDFGDKDMILSQVHYYLKEHTTND